MQIPLDSYSDYRVAFASSRMALTSSQLKTLRSVPAAERVATAIKLAKMQQSDIARATGFTQQWICDLKCGRIGISLGNAHRLAAFFGCRIEDLFPRDQAIAS